MTPYIDVGVDVAHLQAAKQLVEKAYHSTGLPVYLSGHSNGPLYALALLNSVSEDWRRKHIGEFKDCPNQQVNQLFLRALFFSTECKGLFKSILHCTTDFIRRSLLLIEAKGLQETCNIAIVFSFN